MAVGEFGLRDESVVDPFHAQQAGQEVLAGKQRIVAGGGQIVMWMMCLHGIHTEPLDR
jgi:hypothetical protein